MKNLGIIYWTLRITFRLREMRSPPRKSHLDTVRGYPQTLIGASAWMWVSDGQMGTPSRATNIGAAGSIIGLTRITKSISTRLI
jgi:hypothetical protein